MSGYLSTSLALVAFVAGISSGVVGCKIYTDHVRIQTNITERPCSMRLVELETGRQMQFDQYCNVKVRGADEG